MNISKNSPLKAAILFVFCLSLPQWALASCQVVWQPSNQDLAASGWFSGNVYVGGKDRVGYDAEMDALHISQAAGVKRQLAEHRPRDPWVKGNAARMTVEMFIPRGFTANNSSRLAIGIRGGETADQRKISGGVSPREQDGWSLRVNYNRKLSFQAYAYNLNREKRFGGGPRLKQSYPMGQWLTLALDVTLNSPGEANGTGALTIYGPGGRIWDTTSMGGLVWRNTTDWDSFGVILTDKIEAAPPRDQRILYRNFTLSVGDGEDCS